MEPSTLRNPADKGVIERLAHREAATHLLPRLFTEQLNEAWSHALETQHEAGFTVWLTSSRA